LLSAAVSGDIFASPSARQVYGAVKAVPSDNGTILIITNCALLDFVNICPNCSFKILQTPVITCTLVWHVSRREQMESRTLPFYLWEMMSQ